jgi:hypothetical protein
MSAIKNEAFLRCAPEKAFREFADPDFPRRIGFGSGMEVEVLYRDARFVHFRTAVERNGSVHCLESERILAPESLTIVTLRRNLGAFQYNVIVDCFAAHESGTRLTHVDEFQPVMETAASEATLRGMKDSTALFMDKIRAYFASAGPAGSAMAG